MMNFFCLRAGSAGLLLLLGGGVTGCSSIGVASAVSGSIPQGQPANLPSSRLFYKSLFPVFGARAPAVPPAEPQAMPVTGLNVAAVEFAQFGSNNAFAGCFRLAAPGRWVQSSASSADVFEYAEMRRQHDVVSMVDASSGVTIHLNLHSYKVFYSDAATPNQRELYAVIKSYASKSPELQQLVPACEPPLVTGKNVTSVDFSKLGSTDVLGNFKLERFGVWVETKVDSPAVFQYVEMRRQNGFVELVDSARGLTVQLNLLSRKVIFSDVDAPAEWHDLYSIVNLR